MSVTILWRTGHGVKRVHTRLPAWGDMGERLKQTRFGSRILLVEDSDDLRALMVFILEAEGYAVDSARTAEEGLHLLNAHRYDLVLSDYALPGRTGAWLLREAVARHLLSSMNGLIVTAHPQVRDADGFEVIHKPLDFDAFLDRVRCYLDSGSDVSRRVPEQDDRRAQHRQ